MALSAGRAACLLLLAAGALPADSEGVNPAGRSPDTIARGREVYNASCTVCHGVDGSAGDRGPALGAGRRHQRNTDGEIHDAIVNGIAGTGMPAMSLDAMDAWRVVAFLRSLRARAADVPVEGDVDAGARLFWGKAECGRCHMVRGRGGLLGPDLSNLAGRMTLSELRAALTEAKPNVPLGYEPATVTTIDGERIEGVLKNRHNFSYQLLDEHGRLHMLSSSEVARIEIADESLMPADYDERLDERELRDLLAYLTRLVR